MTGKERRVSFIGCGRSGEVLARLVSSSGYGKVGQVLTRSLGSARTVVERLGEGQAVSRYDELVRAPLWVLAVPDDQIARCAGLLAESDVTQGAVVLHLSAVATAAVLNPVQRIGARVASLHPLRSCSDPETVAASFDGSYCGCEGPAREDAAQFARALGAAPFFIASHNKPLYHAASVCASNFIVAIIECARSLAVEAGLSEQEAYAVFEPLVRGTVSGVFSQGTERALTGPVARGDAETVAVHLRALDCIGAQDIGSAYRALTGVLLRLRPSDEIARVLVEP